jgi:hypothetical protein
MSRRLFAFLLAIFLIAFPLNAETEVKFKDIDDNHWAAKSIYNCVRLGITKGYPDGTFRGKEQVNRYELMVFMSNLAIALEKMTNEKIEESLFMNEDGAMSNRALEELKTEIELLKEQIIANNTDGTGSSGLLTKFDIDMYGAARIAAKASGDGKTYNQAEYWQRTQFGLIKNLGQNTGVEFKIDTAYRPMGVIDTYTAENLLLKDIIQAKIWTTKRLNDTWTISFAGTKGPGAQLMLNKKVDLETYGDAVSLGLEGLGFTTKLSYGSAGTTLNTSVANLAADISYKTPVAIPYLGFWTIGYTLEQYSTDKNELVNNIQRTTRYIQKNTFELTDDIRWHTSYIKELREVPTFNVDGDNTHHDSQSNYYDTALEFGDIFNSGTEWTLMHAFKGSAFGSNGLLENIPGVNALGYTSCGYFEDQWDNTSKMPSANITTESGIKIRQNLHNNELFLNIAYVAGTAKPDKDKAEFADDSTVYNYTMALANIDWEVNKGFHAYCTIEQKIMDDSSIDSKQDQYSDIIYLGGVKLQF